MPSFDPSIHQSQSVTKKLQSASEQAKKFQDRSLARQGFVASQNNPSSVLTQQEEPSIVDPIDNIGPYHCTIRFSEYVRPNPNEDEQFEEISRTILPIPMEIRDTISVGYDTVRQELAADLINNGSSMITDLAGSENLAQAGRTIRDALGNSAEAGLNRAGLSYLPRVVGDLPGIRRIAGSEALTSVVQQFFGATTNPNASQVLTGPRLRPYMYTWHLMPHNANESRDILSMVRDLKRRTLPRVLSNRTSGVLGYPQVCIVNFFPWDLKGVGLYGWTPDSIVKHKRSVITNVAANWNNTNAPAFFRGTNMPVSIQLSISFAEIEYFLADDENLQFFDAQPTPPPSPAGVIGQHAQGAVDFLGDTVDIFTDGRNVASTDSQAQQLALLQGEDN